MKKIVAALFLIIFFCFIKSFPQNSNQFFHFNGVFKDESSAVIAGLSLTFDNNGQKINSYTDENGEFQVMLPAGEYKLTINKSISEDFVSYIKIQENRLNPDKVDFIVTPSLECCQTASGAAFPKVISIPKQTFPAAARAVRAFGEVIVSVRVDKDGKVISAAAISGHPLLRQAGVAAAKESLFEPSENTAGREASLFFIFINAADTPKEVKHYSNPYRIEIIGKPLTIDDGY